MLHIKESWLCDVNTVGNLVGLHRCCDTCSPLGKQMWKAVVAGALLLIWGLFLACHRAKVPFVELLVLLSLWHLQYIPVSTMHGPNLIWLSVQKNSDENLTGSGAARCHRGHHSLHCIFKNCVETLVHFLGRMDSVDECSCFLKIPVVG